MYTLYTSHIIKYTYNLCIWWMRRWADVDGWIEMEEFQKEFLPTAVEENKEYGEDVIRQDVVVRVRINKTK